jgi:S1-C subfamily serine protease
MDEQRNPNEYRTGETHPKEKSTGPIAALFICVIFLVGLVSALSLLRDYFEAGNKPPISFTREELTFYTEEQAADPHAAMGFYCQNMSMTYQYLHHLPAGLFINRVEEGSLADFFGVEPGDVLISFDGTPVTHTDTLNQLLANCPQGHRANVVIQHKDGQTAFIITLGQEG